MTFAWLRVENLENVCRICGTHSVEDCEFWVSCISYHTYYITLNYFVFYMHIQYRCNVTCVQIGSMESVYRQGANPRSLLQEKLPISVTSLVLVVALMDNSILIKLHVVAIAAHFHASNVCNYGINNCMHISIAN